MRIAAAVVILVCAFLAPAFAQTALFANANDTTTWNPADKSATVTLSNGNLTAADLGLGQAGGVRTKASFTTQKIYAEFTVPTALANAAIGLSNASYVLTNNAIVFSANAIGAVAGGDIIAQGVTVGTYSSVAPGDVVGMATDGTGRLLWLRVNGGNWNNNGSADPSSGVGGAAVSVTGPLFPTYSTNLDGGGGADSIVARFTGPWAFAPPAGYGRLQ